ncbi:acyl-CoA thioesterase [Sphingobium tyrosinilyticum]|uniref:Acyl-CoA thioesterase n=1 Tax=Sphingobium tyrosinilyticum TaxID=2715436 RepID=A0ABV9EWA8_9SPHN
MAKPESWRLSPETYSFITSMDTRFQDIDTMGHINNVAISGIFETARIRFHHHLGRHPQEQGVRWLVAAVSLNFVEESHFPYPFEVHCGIGHIGRTSWTVSSAAFQKGVCVATCDTTVVTHGSEGRRVIDASLREAMERNFLRKPA